MGMSFALTFITLITASLLFSKFIRKGQKPKNLPKGSLGYLIIGETLSFVKAQRQNKGSEWLEERISKYVAVFKTSLMGSPTVVFNGQAGNKFVLGDPDDVFTSKKPFTLQKIIGEQSLAELTGPRYRLVKGAMLNFLKPECLKNYVKEMDELVRLALQRETKENETIGVVVFMKRLSFDMAFNILFGIKDEQTLDALFEDFSVAFKAFVCLPINFPGTTFWRGQRPGQELLTEYFQSLAKEGKNFQRGF